MVVAGAVADLAEEAFNRVGPHLVHRFITRQRRCNHLRQSAKKLKSKQILMSEMSFFVMLGVIGKGRLRSCITC